MRQASSFLRFLVFLLLCPCFALSYDGPSYDYTAYTECKEVPERPLYNGGILQNELPAFKLSRINDASITYKSPAFVLPNLTQDTIYCFSTWVKIQGAESSLVTASLTTDNATYNCVGTVLAQSGCWSFLKGGFILDAPSNLSTLYFQNSAHKNIDIAIASASLQPFTYQQWRTNQQYIINTARKRAVTIHVSDSHGNRLQEAAITIEQISKDFPLGSAIARLVCGAIQCSSLRNELKWYATEPEQGEVDYSIPDQMLQLIRANQIVARGHNIFWEDPKYTPAWVRNLSGAALKSAVNSRIQSLMSKYKEEFIHWDVSNEMLHFDFYEQRLGPDATLYFYETAHIADPSATLFMNEFNVVETCSDVNSTVDTYVSRLRDLERGGFLSRTSVERRLLASCREWIILWTALHPDGCYQMCLTDDNLQNLPAGDVVDKLLLEWKTGELNGYTDEHGSYSLHGYLGEYRVSVAYGNRAANSTFSLCPSDETKHFNIQL
ncbi:hypothetical protein GH714_031573 [Hevea brasiliensis]|uniref:GH10 domain-containing protein n=1 Tax=Hevea brasiliensis TaxID=3981 RepID=A0A6A6LLY8_HEVBR|nr:hypothetical protein GH714_031573 [Hevea brasiliensis]